MSAIATMARIGLLVVALPLLATPLAPPQPAYAIAATNRLATSLGVSLHPRGEIPTQLQRIAAAGFRIVRVDVTWSAIERARGTFDWSATDTLVRAIAARGLRPLLILAYSNPLYEPALPAADAAGETPVRAPATDESRAAFARFAARAADRYALYRPMLELWNEPNSDHFWPPKASAADYLALAGAACAAIRQVRPDAEILAPGFGNNPRTPAIDSAFLAALGRSPLVGCLSAVSLHPYLFMGVFDDAPRWWQQVRATLGPAASMPLVASEWGLSTYARRLDDLDQASYLVRMAVYDSAAEVRATVWYDWQDDGSERDEPEHHFGLNWPDGSDKPALIALRTMTRALRAYPQLCLVRRGTAVRATFSGSGDAQRMVAWDVQPSGRTPAASVQPLTVRLPAGATVGPVRDVLGHPAAARADGRNLRITSGQPPFYVDLTGAKAGTCMATATDA